MKLLKNNFLYLVEILKADFHRLNMPDFRTEDTIIRQGKKYVPCIIVKPKSSYDASVLGSVVRRYQITTIKK